MDILNIHASLFQFKTTPLPISPLSPSPPLPLSPSPLSLPAVAVAHELYLIYWFSDSYIKITTLLHNYYTTLLNWEMIFF